MLTSSATVVSNDFISRINGCRCYEAYLRIHSFNNTTGNSQFPSITLPHDCNIGFYASDHFEFGGSLELNNVYHNQLSTPPVLFKFLPSLRCSLNYFLDK
jgi:hypothetical protein